MYKSLNQDSQQRIRNIENGFRNPFRDTIFVIIAIV